MCVSVCVCVCVLDVGVLRDNIKHMSAILPTQWIVARHCLAGGASK